VKINKIDNISNVGAYVSKYLSKEKLDERLEGEKCYFCSRSLLKPVIVECPDMVDDIMEQVPDEVCLIEHWYENDYVGVGRYRLYIIT